jgi:uncharacterized membrane protein YcgQ (UPF0703/DUF1980 family)
MRKPLVTIYHLRRVALVGMALGILATCQAQSGEINMWKEFEKVKFRDIYYKEFKDMLPTPQFDDAIRAWEGKVIRLTGYVIPATEAPGFEWIILSRFSFANCFFCGKAGVESIAEVQLDGKRPRFKNDARYTFEGRLRLNKDDWNHLHFILEDARLVR